MPQIPSFIHFQKMLGQTTTDEALSELISASRAKLEYHDKVGALADFDSGFDLIFRGEQRKEKGRSKTVIVLRAIHLFSENYEGHSSYKGGLPGDVLFGESEKKVIKKLGYPIMEGGGGNMPILNKPISRWIRYSLGDDLLRIQFNGKGEVDMVTIFRN